MESEDRRMMDLRFRKVERKIKTTLFSLLRKKDLTGKRLTDFCNLAKISRVAFSKHYSSVKNCLSKTEEQIYRDYLGTLELAKEDRKSKMLAALIFVFREKEYFESVLEAGDYQLLLRMSKKLLEVIDYDYLNFPKAVEVVAHDLVGLLAAWWREDGLNKNKIEIYLNELSKMMLAVNFRLENIAKNTN